MDTAVMAYSRDLGIRLELPRDLMESFLIRKAVDSNA